MLTATPMLTFDRCGAINTKNAAWRVGGTKMYPRPRRAPQSSKLSLDLRTLGSSVGDVDDGRAAQAVRTCGKSRASWRPCAVDSYGGEWGLVRSIGVDASGTPGAAHICVWSILRWALARQTGRYSACRPGAYEGANPRICCPSPECWCLVWVDVFDSFISLLSRRFFEYFSRRARDCHQNMSTSMPSD